MRSIFLRYKWMFFSILFFIIAIPTAGFFLSRNNPKAQTIGLCKQFEKATYPISCQKAVELALANTEGTVKNAAIGSFKFNPVDAKTLGKTEETMWLVDVELKNPFTTLSGREINTFRIGIPLDGTNAIYRVPIKS